MYKMLGQVDSSQLSGTNKIAFKEIMAGLDTIDGTLAGLTSFAQITKEGNLEARRNILIISKKSDNLIKNLAERSIPSVNSSWISEYKEQIGEMKTYTEYAPLWVILSIAIALGLGTMVGWKRIVVTIGEKIGKSHLTYAQGASAELIAAGTITVSSMFGLPVSTTHVLSSGVAGTMVAGSGFKNLQKKTVASIGIAWLITLPVTILFSGMLFLLFRLLFGV